MSPPSSPSEFAALLRDDPPAFLAAMDARNDREPLDLRGADLRGVDLRGITPWTLDLTDADLRGARADVDDLITWRLAGARLDGIELDAPSRPVEVVVALQEGRGLLDRSVPLVRAYLRGVDLAGADLSDVAWPSCQLDGANLRGACLDGAVLQHISAVGACFHGARGSRTNLTYADLRGADLQGTALRLADVRHARLGDADLRDSVWDEPLIAGAQLEGADRRGARWPGAVG